METLLTFHKLPHTMGLTSLEIPFKLSKFREGFSMTIRKRDSKKTKGGYVYEADFYYLEDGIKKRFTKSGFKTKKEAQDYIALKRAELNEKGKIYKDAKRTFNDVYKEFLELGCDNYQHNTIQNTKNMYNMYVKNDLGNYQINKFDYALLQRYFNSISNHGIERNKSIKKAINRVLEFAIKMGYIKNNPIRLVTIKGVDLVTNKEKVISINDFNKVIDSLSVENDFKYKSYTIALQIGLYTGLRISEVLALEKGDIDFKNDLIYINKKLNYQGLKKKEFYVTHQLKSKTSNAYIPLATKLKEILYEWFAINPYEKAVCDRDGNYINPNVFGCDMKKIYNKLNIHLHFHMLRHTYATILINNNVDVKTAQELMRHSNFNTTLSLYTHINDERKKLVINSIFG